MFYVSLLGAAIGFPHTIRKPNVHLINVVRESPVEVHSKRSASNSLIVNNETVGRLKGQSHMSLSNHLNLAANATAVDLMSLLGRCLGNFKMVERVLVAFRESGRTDLQQLQEALDASNFQDAAEILHRFKGSAGNVSATSLHELASNAERFAREQDFDILTATFTKIESAWAEFETFAQAFSPETPTSSRG